MNSPILENLLQSNQCDSLVRLESQNQKKCHHCQQEFNRSTLVFCQIPSCSRGFCVRCLTSKYKYSKYVARRLPTKTWKCPYCTLKCFCKQCISEGRSKVFQKPVKKPKVTDKRSFFKEIESLEEISQRIGFSSNADYLDPIQLEDRRQSVRIKRKFEDQCKFTFVVCKDCGERNIEPNIFSCKLCGNYFCSACASKTLTSSENKFMLAKRLNQTRDNWLCHQCIDLFSSEQNIDCSLFKHKKTEDRIFKIEKMQKGIFPSASSSSYTPQFHTPCNPVSQLDDAAFYPTPHNSSLENFQAPILGSKDQTPKADYNTPHRNEENKDYEKPERQNSSESAFIQYAKLESKMTNTDFNKKTSLTNIFAPTIGNKIQGLSEVQNEFPQFSNQNLAMHPQQYYQGAPEMLGQFVPMANPNMNISQLSNNLINIRNNIHVVPFRIEVRLPPTPIYYSSSQYGNPNYQSNPMLPCNQIAMGQHSMKIQYSMPISSQTHQQMNSEQFSYLNTIQSQRSPMVQIPTTQNSVPDLNELKKNPNQITLPIPFGVSSCKGKNLPSIPLIGNLSEKGSKSENPFFQLQNK